MALSLEAQTKIQAYRQKAREGKLTQEELQEAIKILREDRVAAAQTSAKSRASKAPVNSDALLDELGGL